jgi:cell division protein FtsL
MIRLTTVLWLVVVALVGFAMFKVKYQVQALDDQLAQVHKEIARDRDAVHVLHAEWSFLSQPQRLAELNRKFLNLKPITAGQIERMPQLAELPLRGSTPPAAMPRRKPEPRLATLLASAGERDAR